MPSKHKFIVIILLSTIFGLFSGVVGSIVARVYILEDAFNVPLFGQLSFNEQQQGSNIVIRNAKNVVVEQNVKIDEVARTSKDSLVFIYRKNEEEAVKKTDKSDDLLDGSDRYRIDAYLSQGFVLTSDGWIVTEFLPKDIAPLIKDDKSADAKKSLSEALKNYVVIDKNENQYDVSLIVHDELTDFTYWKIDAKGLSVKKFGLYDDIRNGQIVLAINPQNQIWLTSISGIVKEDDLIEYSDKFDPQLILNEDVEKSFFSSFLFNINGDFMGVIDKTGLVRPISSFVSCINCLLENNEIKRPAFGVYYRDLAKYFYSKKDADKKGALITMNEKGVSVDPASPAEKAGLKENDVITAINGRELNRENSLAHSINSLNVGDVVTVEYLRQGEIFQVEVVLESR